ncbi:uncharacterized protein K452DRAFT_292404 [Aplosporella prunicola CBS 121167]|uniref:Uncharacterized protein n=1 Tax=Aplosporella prunicola CBS 121167 TaxID=1176127 RepID=A0A6A6AWQ4_9PEZI|nr:uncharacterized protein K452DRAFT_292404 [Aplosporella prunicola CBS 121167]KAF2136422.1 hypothetical protein K452DRAFT_292404 [Aplosporella prunicola CBS 121167]
MERYDSSDNDVSDHRHSIYSSCAFDLRYVVYYLLPSWARQVLISQAAATTGSRLNKALAGRGLAAKIVVYGAVVGAFGLLGVFVR